MSTSTVHQRVAQCKVASKALLATTSHVKNQGLKAIIAELRSRSSEIFSANREDLRRSEEEALAAPLLKRLKFDESKLNGTLKGIGDLISLEDPVHRPLERRELDRGLVLERVSSPLGVVAMIFESRPDALVQIACLCLKSGNGVVLKGGSEARETNRVMASIIHDAGVRAGLADHWLVLLESRQEVGELLALDQLVDVVIPRGSNEFVQYIMNHSNIPVLGHADGVCHQYVDSEADLAMALEVVDDSKTQYVAVCNATETLLVHRAIAQEFLPLLARRFEGRVELRGDSDAQAIVPMEAASESDWSAEYLDYTLSVKVVDSVDEAIDHINRYGSGHTDGIITANSQRAEDFMNRVDSASVYHNASTRFADGYVYGLGAEVGIATGKIHARGPVGMEGLLIYKWKLRGAGHIIGPYSKGDAQYTHKNLL